MTNEVLLSSTSLKGYTKAAYYLDLANFHSKHYIIAKASPIENWIYLTVTLRSAAFSMAV